MEVTLGGEGNGRFEASTVELLIQGEMNAESEIVGDTNYQVWERQDQRDELWVASNGQRGPSPAPAVETWLSVSVLLNKILMRLVNS